MQHPSFNPPDLKLHRHSRGQAERVRQKRSTHSHCHVGVERAAALLLHQGGFADTAVAEQHQLAARRAARNSRYAADTW